MTLALETQNRHAFESVASAIDAINYYKRSRDRHVLEGALAGLKEARRHDEHYLLAPYYMAVIEDLLGRSRDAAEHLRAILSESATAQPYLVNEMRFNLAVAQYHGYSHQHLRAAAETLARVLSDTATLRGYTKYYRVRLHSRALLAQVYAMWSIPRSPEDASEEIECVRISFCYNHATSNARRVVWSPLLFFLALVDKARFREIKAIANNAFGMAEMYYTDFFVERSSKIARLRWGLGRLMKSDRLFPRDWANYCDIGSCHMRLGYWGKDPSEFELARRYLTAVITELRPDYGFALYEIGRCYRIQGRFDKALEYLNRAMEVTSDREVSDRRVQREIDLATTANDRYP